MPVFRQRTELDHPVEEVFAWHLRPGAFERLTPPWESVRVRQRTGEIADGGRVELGLRKGPTELTWEAEHTGYEENRLIRDEQVRGPFGRWVHDHRFHDLGGGRSAVEDVVEWEAPLGSLGRTFGGGFIRRTLERLFAFRHQRLADDLARHHAYSDEPLTVAVSGSSGLIGSQLVPFLTTGGHRVRRLVRTPDPSDPDAIPWNVRRGELDRGRLEGVDAVVHLAGESIYGVRWTAAKKREILESRRRGTLLLARALAALDQPPATLVSASGVHFYGNRGDEAVGEEAGPGEGFLADVCREWEEAAEPARKAGIRVVHARSGVALSPAGGALGTMLLPFRMGVGGRVGGGRQYLSWIDMDDHVGLVLHALTRETVEGPVNFTSPYPVTNATFTDALGRVLGRPTLLPLPATGVRILMGQMGEELLLTGVRALPRKAEATGYEFFRPGVEEALRFELGRPLPAGAPPEPDPAEPREGRDPWAET